MSVLAALAGRLDARPRGIVVVTGKGGTGKTTTAAALALRFADSGLPTHLLSTDPAHSVGDVFDLTLAARPRPSPCTPALMLEELDARAYAREWVQRLAPDIARLVEAGTYLDAEDARSLTDLSLPGVDEIMAALRLVELAPADAARLVVDTAPTGHALRLLDAGELVAGWVAALEAMAEKARAVASGLLGVAVRVPGEPAVAELRAEVARFQAEVLARATFVVVTRPESVVQAETERLLGELRRRGLPVAAVLVTGGIGDDATADPPRFAVPLVSPAPRGCAALRAWGDDSPAAAASSGGGRRPGVPAPASGEAPVGAARPGERTAAAQLLRRPQSLFLFAGKGGVGKTTCAAACALGLSVDREVLLLSTDPAGSLEDVLGVPVPAEGARVGRMLARQVDGPAELRRMEEQYRREVDAAFAAVGLQSAAALDRAVMEGLWGLAPPGVDELLALARIVRSLATGVTLVIDPAPTGHFLRLLEMPAIALDWVHAFMRLILKYGLAPELDAVARDLLEFARDCKDFLARLADSGRTAAFVVTLDEPVVAAETDRLLGALVAAHVPLAGVILNRAEAGPPHGAGGPGSPRATTVAAPPAPLLLAPCLPAPPIGPDALRGFLRRWEFAP